MPPELIEIAKTAGPVASLLVLIGWWGLNKKWVFGWLYEQEQQRARDDHKRHTEEIAKKDAEIVRWQNMAIDLAGMADYASRQAVKAVDRRARPGTAPRVPPRPTVDPDL